MFETLRTAYRKDPALKSGINILEVILYPGVWAIWIYRVSHALHVARIPFLPRLLSELSRFITHIEIHPGARIGRRFFIDHGHGIVIGETTEIGDDVMMYQGVTLGGHGWWTDKKGNKRHPTIEDGVVLGVDSIVLGPVIVGSNSRIGAKAVVIKDIPPDSTIVGELGHYLVKAGKRLDRKTAEQSDLPRPEWYQ